MYYTFLRNELACSQGKRREEKEKRRARKENQKRRKGGVLNNTRGGGYFCTKRGGRKEGKGSCRFTGQRGERFGSLETPKIGIIK